MGIIIHAFELLAHRLLAVAVGLRSFRGSPDDAHALVHAAVAQAALDSEHCSGVCRADVILDALEARRRAN